MALLQEQIYPQLYRYILHPCVSWPGLPNMCGGLHAATGCLRFDSFLTQDNVVIMLIYEVTVKRRNPSSLPSRGACSPGSCTLKKALRAFVRIRHADQWRSEEGSLSALPNQVFPKCGDGVDFAVTLTPVDGSEVQILHEVPSRARHAHCMAHASCWHLRHPADANAPTNTGRMRSHSPSRSEAA